MNTAQKWFRRGKAGFTLVELLAVLAIIGILAAIVVPRIARHIATARRTKAVSEIHNAETALAGILAQTGRSNFRDFLVVNNGQTVLDGFSQQIAAGNIAAVKQAQDFYNQFFYELLRQGKDSDFIKANVLDEVRQKIGTSSMNLGKDPWGQQYNFWMGPLRGAVPLRSYRIRPKTDPNFVEPDSAGFAAINAYIYDANAQAAEQAKLPGQPAHDDQMIIGQYGTMLPGIQAYGYPAPRDTEVFMWSSGANQANDANLLLQMNRGVANTDPVFLGGGDDENSWDNEGGWESAPKV